MKTITAADAPTFTTVGDKTQMHVDGKIFRFTSEPPVDVVWTATHYTDDRGRSIRTGLWTNGQGHVFRVASPCR